MRVFPIITAAAAVLVLTGCGGSHHAAAPATPTAVPSPTFDGSTVAACKEAALVAVGKDGGDNAHAKLARGDAELSDVPTLRELAKKYSDAAPGSTLDGVRALTAAYELETWCIQHGVKVK